MDSRRLRPTDRLERPPIAAGPAAGRNLIRIDRIGAPARSGGNPSPKTAFSVDGRGALGGISSASTRSQSRLSSSLPGTIAGPLLPRPRLRPSSTGRVCPLVPSPSGSQGIAEPESGQSSHRTRDLARQTRQPCIGAAGQRQKAAQSVRDPWSHVVSCSHRETTTVEGTPRRSVERRPGDESVPPNRGSSYRPELF